MQDSVLHTALGSLQVCRAAACWQAGRLAFALLLQEQAGKRRASPGHREAGEQQTPIAWHRLVFPDAGGQ